GEDRARRGPAGAPSHHPGGGRPRPRRGVPPRVGGKRLAGVPPPRRCPRLDPPPVRDGPGDVRRVHYFAGAFAAGFACAGAGFGSSGASTITSRTSTPSGTLPGSNK